MLEDYAEKDSMALGENDLPKLRSYQPAQLFFLMRLGRLLRLRQGASDQGTGEWLVRLLNKAIYSTYRDCVELGLGEDARVLFSKITAERRG